VKGWRFLRDKTDVIQAGDEMRVPGRAPRWEAVGPHAIGIRYTRHYCKMTLRRRVPNSPICVNNEQGRVGRKKLT